MMKTTDDGKADDLLLPSSFTTAGKCKANRSDRQTNIVQRDGRDDEALIASDSWACSRLCSAFYNGYMRSYLCEFIRFA